MNLDLLIIILFLLLFISLGVFFSRSNKTSTDYFKGDGSIPWVVAMFSIVASETSVLTFAGIPGIAYNQGWWFIQLAIGYIIGRTLVSFYLLPKYFSSDVISIYEVIGSHYGPLIHKFSSVVFLLTRLLADGIRFLLTAILFDVLTGWGIVNCVLIIGLITLLYSYIGGIKSILWIDSIQFFIYLGGGIISIFYLCSFLTSNQVMDVINSSLTSVFIFEGSIIKDSNLFISGIIGGTLLSFSSHGVDYMMVQRALSCNNLSNAKKAMIGSGFFVLIQFSIFLLIGSLLKEFYMTVDFSAISSSYVEGGAFKKDRELAHFIATYLPVGVRGILIAGIMSAAMSTLSSSINSLSSSTVRDILGIKDDISLSKRISIFWALALIVIASVFDESNSSLVITGLTIASFTYGILLSLFLIQLMDKKPKDWMILIGSFCGISSVFVLQSYGVAWTWFIMISTAVNMGISLTLLNLFSNER